MDDPVLAIQIAVYQIQCHHIIFFLRHIRIFRIITVAFIVEYGLLRILVAPFERLYRDDGLVGHGNQILFQPKRTVTIVLAQPVRINPSVGHHIIPRVHDLVGSQHHRQQVVGHKTVKAAALIRVRQILPFGEVRPGISPHVFQRPDTVQGQHGIRFQ